MLRHGVIVPHLSPQRYLPDLLSGIQRLPVDTGHRGRVIHVLVWHAAGIPPIQAASFKVAIDQERIPGGADVGCDRCHGGDQGHCGGGRECDCGTGERDDVELGVRGDSESDRREGNTYSVPLGDCTGWEIDCGGGDGNSNSLGWLRDFYHHGGLNDASSDELPRPLPYRRSSRGGEVGRRLRVRLQCWSIKRRIRDDNSTEYSAHLAS